MQAGGVGELGRKDTILVDAQGGHMHAEYISQSISHRTAGRRHSDDGDVDCTNDRVRLSGTVLVRERERECSCFLVRAQGGGL